ncbi:MAG: LytR/AlgR family response regulator transcription factor [Thermonemataceae bacterium]
MQTRLSCLIVDDSNVNLLLISKFVEKTDFLELKETFTNPIDAFSYLQENKVDILLLDIEMPEMSGLDLLKALNTPPVTILITSKKEFALEAYDLDVVDYIVKPPDYARFLKSVSKAQQVIQNRQSSAATSSKQEEDIFVKVEQKLIRLKPREITYIEALSDYILIHTLEGRQYIVYSSMKTFEEKLKNLGFDYFLRIHRSHIINMQHIELLEHESVVIKGKYLSIGKTYREAFMQQIKKL